MTDNEVTGESSWGNGRREGAKSAWGFPLNTQEGFLPLPLVVAAFLVGLHLCWTLLDGRVLDTLHFDPES